MADGCQFFPELFRLFDAEEDRGEAPTPADLRALVELCNYCALCPCPNIRADILAAKTAFIRRDGLPVSVRLLADVARMGRICGALPGLSNLLFQNPLSGTVVKKALGIHPARKMPRLPEKSFDAWAEAEGLTRKPDAPPGRKVAYFAGCTARFLFPQVPRAVVRVLRHNGLAVYYPDQNCCGMPTFLEGDRAKTLELARANLRNLAGLLEEGFELVASCPTCGFFMKTVQPQKAYYSKEYQATLEGPEELIKIPINPRDRSGRKRAYMMAHYHPGTETEGGYFEALDPVGRVAIAERVLDLGEYLELLHRAGELKAPAAKIDSRTTYFPPCHQREQNIGSPYIKLLGFAAGTEPEIIGGALDCCGLAGIMGFKKDFHQASLAMGRNLAARIKELAPELLVTDCLSCRLQFRQITDREVRHPIELLARAYGLSETD